MYDNIKLITGLTEIKIAQAELKIIEKKISNNRLSTIRILSRLLINIILKLFYNADVQLKFINIIKTFGQNKKITVSPDNFIVNKIRSFPVGSIRYPDNRRYYIGLSFDIDNVRDYESLPRITDLLIKNRLPATINFITHGDYSIDGTYMEHLNKHNIEIGLHGDTHNTALAYLPHKLIERKLKKAIDKLGFMPHGFRSPGLCFSDRLARTLDKLGFLYDSSLSTGIGAYQSIEYPYVFVLKDTSLFEIPLFIQDFNFYYGVHLNQADVLKQYIALIRSLTKIRGAAVLNFHPHIIRNNLSFFEGIIQYTNNESGTAYVSSLKDIILFYKKTLTRDRGINRIF